ncbi:MAG: class I SAM-dependent methyltransferase [Rhodospirillaceae bacterium]|nr:MAG: class I SAM-dependent methyltransferase [Rhodospirillaceae bacterium]
MTDVAVALRERIRRDGPVPLVDAMATAAEHYYGHGKVFGRDGDFITAPDISQAFGELIGLWCAVVWERMGRPAPFRLVEYGPGRGTLMADLLRAVARVPGFTDAVDIHLVERSATLRTTQRDALPNARITWHTETGTIPTGPMIAIGNEFADALPIQQFVRSVGGWNERHVGWNGDAFVFVDLPAARPPIPPALADAPTGAVFEHCPTARTWIAALAQRIVHDGGATLVIDYGHVTSSLGDTLQAVKQHRFHPVLNDLGTADLTAHVDFDALAAAARSKGAVVLGPVAQGTWLAQLGIAVRVAQLTRGQDAARANEIAAAARRLTSPDGMGLLFKVMAVIHPTLADPALATLDGFAQDAAP